MAFARGTPRIEKQILVASLLFAAAMLGLIAYAALRLGISVPGCVTDVKPFTSGEIIQVGAGRYEVHAVAYNWEFTPSPLTVPKGSVVDFYLTSTDVVHGFHIDGTDVNLMAIPNVVNYAQVRFDKLGKHPVRCHEYCGPGHDQMLGMIEVTP